MTEKKISPDKKIPETLSFALKLFAVIMLGFLAGLVFRPSVGILSMLPLAFLLCGVASCIKVKSRYKLLICPAMVFMLNTIEKDDMRVSLTFTALCLLANIVFEYAAHAFRNKQKRFFAVAPIGSVICIALSFYFIGSPFTAISANRTLSDYTESKYPENENGYFGEFEFSSIRYNNQTKTYYYNAKSSTFPTEIGEISIKNGIVRDGFEPMLERKIKVPYESDFTAYLRKIFPTDSFTVDCVSIASTPDQSILISENLSLKESASYEIHLGGIQTADDMLKRVKYYVS